MRKISLFILFLSSVLLVLSQGRHDTEDQLQRMKNDYQEWLSKRAVNDLLVEYDPSPVALETPNPRFSWIMDLQGRERRQTACQVLVASDRKSLDAGAGDMWNSELVDSDQSSQIDRKSVV